MIKIQGHGAKPHLWWFRFCLFCSLFVASCFHFLVLPKVFNVSIRKDYQINYLMWLILHRRTLFTNPWKAKWFSLSDNNNYLTHVFPRYGEFCYHHFQCQIPPKKLIVVCTFNEHILSSLDRQFRQNFTKCLRAPFSILVTHD